MVIDYDFVSRITVINEMISDKNPQDLDMKQLRIFFDSIVKKDSPFLETGKQDFKEVMGKVLDLTKNPGTNSLAKLWYFIFQSDRRDARARAVEIIIKHTGFEIKKGETAWDKITGMLSSQDDKIDVPLLKALLAKYKSHGLYKHDLKKLNDLQLKNLYVLTDELDLTKVPQRMIEQDGFLVGLLNAAGEKKDYETMKSIFRAAERASTLDKTIYLQYKLLKAPPLIKRLPILGVRFSSHQKQGVASKIIITYAKQRFILRLRAHVLDRITQMQAPSTSLDATNSP
jgi:hypothetical protein